MPATAEVVASRAGSIAMAVDGVKSVRNDLVVR